MFVSLGIIDVKRYFKGKISISGVGRIWKDAPFCVGSSVGRGKLERIDDY